MLTWLVAAATAIAVPPPPEAAFDWAPEVHAPRWATSVPYQRNVYWDFEVDPRGGPTANGAPGAQYFGYDDPELRVSDYCEFTGDATWYPQVTGVPNADPAGPPVDMSGVIGIDNRQGTTDLAGQMIFHLDNHDRNWFKRIWVEKDFLMWALSIVDVNPEPGTDVVDLWFSAGRPTGDGRNRQNMWWEIVPNPLWEDIVIDIYVPAGNYMLIDNLHIATECIPEPGALALLAPAGLLALVRRRRR